jgi:ribosomal protein L23
MRNLTIIAALLLALVVGAFARDTAVVVAKSNTTKTLALADLTKMAKTSKKWADGKPVVFILRDPSAPEMKTAISKIFGMTADEVKTLIAENKQSFVVVRTDADVVKAVQANPNAIGLTDVYSITSGVNVLKLDGKMPLEPGYALHGQ